MIFDVFNLSDKIGASLLPIVAQTKKWLHRQSSNLIVAAWIDMTQNVCYVS